MPKNKEIDKYPKLCLFSIDLSSQNTETDESNVSAPFLILEHTQQDDFKYKNGLIAFTLSEKKLQDMAKSFNKKALGRNLYINYDHEPNGSTLASGWFRDVYVEKTDKGYGLFARAEWTPKAKEHIKNREYAYFSCECKIEGMKIESFENFDLKVKKSVLTGGALTNNPFFTTTNLSLSNNENEGDFEMEKEFAKLNAELEQLKLDRENELKKMQEGIAEMKKLLLSKDAQVADLEKSNKEAIINVYLSKLPNIEEKRSEVKVELEELFNDVGHIKFAKYAEAIIQKHDTKVKFNQLSDNVAFEVRDVDMSDEELNEEALADLRVKFSKK